MKLANKLIIVAFACFGNFPVEAAETWKIASLEWPPFSGEKLLDGGSAIKALRDTLKEHDIELVVEYYPWTRAIAQASSPSMIGFYPAWPEDVGKGFSLSGTLFKSPMIIAQNRKAPFNIKSLSDLKGKVVGTVQDYGNTKEFNDMVAKGIIIGDSGPDDLIGVKKLGASRIDAMIIDRNVLNYILKFQYVVPGEPIFDSGGWIAQKELLVAVNNAHPKKNEIIALLNKISKAAKTQKMVDAANKIIFQ